MQRRNRAPGGRGRRLAALVAVVGVIVATLTAPAALAAPVLPDPSPDAVTAVASLSKTASVSQVAPGETFAYQLTVGCSSITDNGCRGAVLTDVIPAPFVLVSALVGGGANTAETPVIAGNSLTVNWNTPLGDGTVGILDATTAVVDVFVRLPADASFDVSGKEVLNDAALEGVNFVDAQDQVGVTPVVALELATAATKTLSPTSLVAVPGATVTAALGATNGSNATVETLVIQDPVDPSASPNPFELLGFAAFGAVTPPTGATSTAYSVFVGGAWVDVPGGVLPGTIDPADVRGTRIAFSGAIPPGASASASLSLTLTDAAALQPDGSAVANSSSSTVGLSGATAVDTAEASVTLQQNTVQVSAAKQFSPDLVIAGQSTVVTVEATNASAIPLDSLTVTEPSSGSFPAEYTFQGFTAPVDYPAGATSASVIYRFADGTTEELPFADGATPEDPVLNPFADVTSFDVVFEGTAIIPGAEVALAFGLDTDPSLTGLPRAVTNDVLVTGTNLGAIASALAADDLDIYDEVIETYIGKSLRPPSILAAPGQLTTVSLTGGLTERPNPPAQPTGSTGNAARIVIQDPVDPASSDDWWNAFDVVSIAQTPVPADSQLTVEYYDTADGTWKALLGPVAGPAIVSDPVPGAVREVAGGIRFVYDYTGAAGGFAPGTDLAPNFTSALRADGRYTPGPPFSTTAPTQIENCAQSSATSPTAGVAGATAAIPSPCPLIEIVPPVAGGGDLVDKAFGTSSSGGLKSVIARSLDTIPSTLTWSTGGYSGLERVEITDIADPEGTAIADSVYDAFDLFRVQPITTATDPLIAYDQIQQVLLYDGSSWTPAANSPCPAGCVGQFPGVTLTLAERATTRGVRLVVVESPNRSAVIAGDLDAPPVGSGVARSTGNSRPVALTWRIRDETRSTGAPVLGDGSFNLPEAGIVRNTVNLTAYPSTGGTPLTADDSDDVVIIDVPLTTTTDKNWSGGPLGVPPDATVFPSGFPISRATVTTRNTTPARIDELVITDPAPGSFSGPREDPFNAFLLFRFAAITPPSGTTSTVVTLSCPDGSQLDYTAAQALGLTTMPCDVTGFTVAFDGRIAAGASGVVSVDLRLRDYWRGTQTRVTLLDSPISNTARGVVADVDPPAACPPATGQRYACDEGSASIVLESPTFAVVPGKSIAPAFQKENDFAPVTVTLRGQPAGSLRTASMTLEDADPSFWNAVDFVGTSPSWTLPAPLDRVSACYLSGGTFTDADVTAGSVGGTWTCGPAGTTTQAAAFLAAAPDGIHGVRFTLAQANGLGWSNPQNPVVTVPFLVERRSTLRTGGPVPTTRSDQIAAPGEAEAGTFVDTVSVSSTSVELAAGQPITLVQTADASYRNVHLTAQVNVVKSPNGNVQPGAVIPFALSFTNTGESALNDPVFSDRLPTDAQGRQLILDPDRDPSVSPYSFALTGAAPTPPTGLPLPTDPAVVRIQEVGDTVFFRMPQGAVLEPGQTYTITARLVLRPGLTPADTVQNVAAMTAFQPFDDCAPTLEAGTGACIDSATVSPLAVPALSTVKYVKADAPHGQAGIPEIISTANGFSCDGQADADGFYRSPCVPVTLPGATETWRFTVTNAGTLPLDKVVSIDNLPTPGDRGIIVQLPRESEWPVGFLGAGGIVPTPTTPQGAVVTTYWSGSSLPCTADLNPLGTPCAAAAWQALTPATDLSAVRSLKFVVDFPVELLMPGESLNIEYQTRTAPARVTTTDFPKAWNTVTTGGSAVLNAARVLVPPTEGRRVGVAHPTGPVQIVKTVSGPGQAFAPDTFPVQLACTSAGAALTGEPLLVLTAGAAPSTVQGLPWGAECTATEPDSGQTSSIIGTAVVGGPEDPIGLVTVENVFEVGTLEVSKLVVGNALDEQGAPIVYGPFDFAVDCLFLGDPVFADGYAADDPMEQSLSDGQTWSLTGLPVGAECTVTETDAAGALDTIFVIGEPGQSPFPVFDTAADVAIGLGAPSEAVAVNVFDVGSLTLEKVVDAPEDAVFAAGPFSLRVTCTLPTVGVVYDGVVVLGGDEPLTETITDLAAGSSCEVTEPDPGGANEVEIAGSPAVVGTDAPATVTVTNTFLQGSLEVVKQIEGPGAELYGSGPFEVSLDCVVDSPSGVRPVEVTGGATRVLSAENGYTASYDPLLVGSTCTLRETGTGGATTSEIDGGSSATTDIVEGVSQAGLVNTFEVGSLIVSKSLSGGDAPAHTGDVFEVSVTCTWNGAAVAIPGGATRPLSVSTPAEYADLPVGAECAVAEQDDGGATAVSATPASADDPRVGIATIAVGSAASVTIDNRFDPALPPTGFDLVRAGAVSALGLLLVFFGMLAVRRRRRV